MAVQLEVANAELRQQLQGTTSRLQDMEAAMGRLLDQQVCCECSGAVSGTAEALVIVKTLTGLDAATVAASGRHEWHQQVHSSSRSVLCISVVSVLKHPCVLVCAGALVQAVGVSVQSTQLTAERDRAVAALDEATKAAAAAQQDAARYSILQHPVAR
jgi:hypothetical protein